MNNPTIQIPIETIGVVLRDAIVPQAIHIIQHECHDLTIQKKVGYDGIKDDLATNGDKKAQEMYMREIKLHFPDFGIIAEEGNIMIEGREVSGDIHFTVDPLDGTKAYERGSSQGVSTMIALVRDGEVIAAYIGDANTSEIYGFAGFEKYGPVMRQRFGVTTELKPETTRSLTKQYVLLRDAPRKQPELVNAMIDDTNKGGLFKSIEVAGGSIGITLTRLWKGEVGAIVLDPIFDTPWDLAPILGISRRLGFLHYKFDEKQNTFIKHEPVVVKTVTEKPYTEIIIHETHKEEFEMWLGRRYG